MTERTDTVVGRNVRNLRSERGLSQRDLAARMYAAGHHGWGTGTVTSIETGRRKISLDELGTLSLVLRASLDQFFQGDPNSVVGPGNALGEVRRSLLGLYRAEETIGELGKLEEALASDSAAQLEKALAARLVRVLGRAVSVSEARTLAGDALGESIFAARQRKLDNWRGALELERERLRPHIEAQQKEYDDLVLAQAEARRSGGDPPSKDAIRAAENALAGLEDEAADLNYETAKTPQRTGHFSRGLIDEVERYARVVERHKTSKEGK